MNSNYAFHSRWNVAVAREVLWDALEDLLASDDPMAWWGSVEVTDYDGHNLAVRAASHFGYRLTFRLTDLEQSRPQRLTFGSGGDLKGSGLVSFVDLGPECVGDGHRLAGDRRSTMDAVDRVGAAARVRRRAPPDHASGREASERVAGVRQSVQTAVRAVEVEERHPLRRGEWKVERRRLLRRRRLRTLTGNSRPTLSSASAWPSHRAGITFMTRFAGGSFLPSGTSTSDGESSVWLNRIVDPNPPKCTSSRCPWVSCVTGRWSTDLVPTPTMVGSPTSSFAASVSAPSAQSRSSASEMVP